MIITHVFVCKFCLFFRKQCFACITFYFCKYFWRKQIVFLYCCWWKKEATVGLKNLKWKVQFRGSFLKMFIASKVSKSKVKKFYPKHYYWKYQLITSCHIFPLILAYCKKAVLLLTFRAAVQKADKVNKC